MTGGRCINFALQFSRNSYIVYAVNTIVKLTFQYNAERPIQHTLKANILKAHNSKSGGWPLASWQQRAQGGLISHSS